MAKKDQPVEAPDVVNADKATDAATLPTDIAAPVTAVKPAKPDSVVAKKPKAWVAGSLSFLALAGVAALGFYGWQYQQSNQQQLASLNDQLQRGQQNKQQQLEQLSALRAEFTDGLQANQQSLAAVEKRIEQQGKRLQSLTNTSREDWQLAEAEYLLRIAGQRLLMERGTQGAIALLEAADQLLLKLKDLDLFSVREKLSRDITALKLANTVDQAGIYLRLAGLSEQVMQLPLLPNQLREASTVSADASGAAINTPVNATGSAEAPAPLTLWQQLQQNFFTAFSGLSEFIKIRQHDQAPQTRLPIDGGLYLQQNIRLSIESAQLALLREEQGIYSGSLQQAAELLSRYYDTQAQARELVSVLQTQARQVIVAELQSINGSLLALQDYTAQLHKLGGVSAASETTNISPNTAAED